MDEDSKNLKWLKARWFGAVNSFSKKHKDKNIRPYLERAVNDFEKNLESEAIPAALTLLPAEDPEQKIIAVHLRPRCLDHSQISEMQKEAAKSLIHTLFQINTATKSDAQQSGLIRDKIANQNEYAFLYSGLSPDVEILEVQYCGTGRIFGFFTQTTFNVVCVRTVHIENH
jgi:hypothetical protein